MKAPISDCPICGKEFYYETTELKNHNEFECPKCNNSFEFDIDDKTLELFKDFDKAFNSFNNSMKSEF